ncbi:hypothetical protein OG930_04860 [Streptomyces sp. NBC_01799]|nr:hypothetical protein [Streptomyces sp. NBC_01800]WSA66391.1 hypothetical protein OIE65_04935 [Streptomyces sp. NBC_01800]WSA74992.1 hypothetical protein OG930_04860 [Streptomyces sp. NBC_01799]
MAGPRPSQPQHAVVLVLAHAERNHLAQRVARHGLAVRVSEEE